MTNPPKTGIDSKPLRGYSEPVTALVEAAKFIGYWLLSILALVAILVTLPLWIVPVALGVRALAIMHDESD